MLVMTASLWSLRGNVMTKSFRANQGAVVFTRAAISGKTRDALLVVDQIGGKQHGYFFWHSYWRIIFLLEAGKRAANERRWEESIRYIQAAHDEDYQRDNDHSNRGYLKGALIRKANVLRHNLGDLLLGGRRWHEAIIIYKDIISVSPKDSVARAYLGWAMYKGGKPLNDSIKQIRYSILLSPEYELGYRLLAHVYLNEGKYTEAEIMVQKAIALAPNLAHLQALWAEILLAKGDEMRAVDVLTKALVRFPENAYFYYLLALAYEKQGDVAHAVIAIEKALMLDGASNVWYWVRAGKIYELDKQVRKASFAYQKALSIEDSSNGSAWNAAREGLSRLELMRLEPIPQK